MANNVSNITALQACTAPKSSDKLMILSANTTANTLVLKSGNVASLFTNVASIIISKTDTPVSNNGTGLSLKQFWFDDSYMYVVTSNSIIKRVPLQTFS